MASHCQPYYSCHHHPNIAPTTTAAATSSCYCCSCYSSYTPPHHPLPPDPHLHHHQLPPQPHPFSLYTPQTYQYHHPSQLHPKPPQDPHFFQEFPLHHHHHHDRKEESKHPFIISSLLRRISALEAALKHYSSSSSSPNTLRDAAAHTIQTHFRAFLVRRSRTLGELEELASIKSTLNALKSSVSENTHFDRQAFSVKAMDLLLKLDSIQGGDPMIRDGKRSISRELIRLMDFIDGVNVKMNELASRIVKNVRCGGNNNNIRDVCTNKQRVNVESVKICRHGDVIGKLKERIERINGLSRVSKEDGEEDEEPEPIISLATRSEVGIGKRGGLMKGNTGAQAKAKRSVRFVEDGNLHRVLSSHDPVSNGDCNSMDGSDSAEIEGELVNNLGRKVEEIGLLAKEIDSDEEEILREVRGALDRRTNDQEEDGSFVFSAPLPVKMESRADFMKKRKSVKV